MKTIPYLMTMSFFVGALSVGCTQNKEVSSTLHYISLQFPKKSKLSSIHIASLPAKQEDAFVPLLSKFFYLAHARCQLSQQEVRTIQGSVELEAQQRACRPLFHTGSESRNRCLRLSFPCQEALRIHKKNMLPTSMLSLYFRAHLKHRPRTRQNHAM